MKVRSKASIIACAACSVAALAMPTTVPQHLFTLRRGPAAVTIPEFARQAGVQILMPEEAARGRTTHEVRGALSLPDALRRLLQGSDIVVTYSDGRTAGAEWLNARFTDYPDARGTVALPTGGNALTEVDGTGNHLPFSPGLSLSASASYKLAAWGGELQASTTARYTTRYFSEANNFLVQPAYGLVNAQLTWQRSDHRYAVTVWSNNLTNSFYAAALTAQPAASVVSPGAPRTFGTTLELNF